jgi:hypothetical protein
MSFLELHRATCHLSPILCRSQFFTGASNPPSEACIFPITRCLLDLYYSMCVFNAPSQKFIAARFAAEERK